MQNKILGLIFLLFFPLIGQENYTVSPSAIAGIGEFNDISTTNFSTLGKKQTGWVSNTEIQINNPAAHVFLDYPIFNVDVVGKLAFLKDKNNIRDFRQYYGLQNVGFGFSIRKKWGTYLGISPFSNNGYYYELNETIDDKNVRKISQGKGSIYQLIWGNSFMIFQSEKQALSLGFNLKYFFGEIRDEQKTDFLGAINTTNFSFNQVRDWNDFGVDFGAYYHIKLTPDWALGLGARYTLGKYMNIVRQNSFQSYIVNIDGLTIYQPPIDGSKNSEKLFLPQSFGIGGTGNFKNKIIFGLDFSFQELDKLKPIDQKVSSIWELGAGLELKPGGVNPIGLAAYKRLNYRFGANIGTIATGSGLKYSAQTGLGIPVLIKYLKSTINIGVVYDHIAPSVLKEEQYLSFYIGFSLGPAAYESWFKRRAYN